MLNLMQENLIRTQTSEGETKLSLPAVFAGLVANRVDGFPALRAHQRHAWHAFLCQLGAMAMYRAGLAGLPTDEAAWREIILALTPGADAETAWCLVAAPDRPAFLQPPIPDGMAALGTVIKTPDGIDITITANNHDFKSALIAKGQPDDWLFALMTLQTMQGYGGQYYGISRMDGRTGSRPAVSIMPSGGCGAHFCRDVLRLLAIRADITAIGQTAASGGIGLLWLRPWPKTDQLKPAVLDPFYIEICRRIRLVKSEGGLIARTGIGTSDRVQPTTGGITGDPWAPLKQDKNGRWGVFTLDPSGFSYRRMVDLMFEENGFKWSPLQALAETDAPNGLLLIARGLVRDKMKTKTHGYHERIVPLSRMMRRGLRIDPTDPISHMAKERVLMAGEVQRVVLKPALFSLFQNGPDKINEKHVATMRKAQPFLEDFDRIVDQDFFSALWEEAEAGTAEEQIAARTAWLQTLLKQGDKILRRADTAAPKSSHRHFRALSHALDVLRNAPWRSETLKGWMPETPKPEVEHAA
jgi:CRISPR system Cascade subunit CasA